MNSQDCQRIIIIIIIYWKKQVTNVHA